MVAAGIRWVRVGWVARYRATKTGGRAYERTIGCDFIKPGITGGLYRFSQNDYPLEVMFRKIWGASWVPYT